MKRIIKTDKVASSPLYSQAVEVNGMLFMSGQLPIDINTGKFASYDVKGQTRQVFKNIEAILTEAGYQMTNIVKMTVFLADINLFADMNEVYSSMFDGTPPPARSAFAVKDLPMGALIEIEVVAAK